MINILIREYETLNAVTWWRLYRPFMVMRYLYPGKYNIKTTRRPTVDDVWYSDIFILSRPADQDTLEFVRFVRGIRPDAKFILDIDDAIANVPAHHTEAMYFANRAHISREIFSMCDYFWVSTEQLLYECDCLGKGEIIPNAILPEDLPKEPAPDRGRWMWRGKDIQKEDVYLAGAETYEQIKSKATQWTFWGCLPSLDHGQNIRLLEYSDGIVSYFDQLKAERFNGVWKPLVENQFNDAKSNIAWLEATMSGGVCLTNYAGKHGWQCAFDKWPSDYEHACAAWEVSADVIRSHYNLETTAKQRHESIERILNNKSVLL
jgi:hypothetical protein